MLLGVYRYYGFSKSLYHFDFFTFRPGLGGYTDGPAELMATVQAPAPGARRAARSPDGCLAGGAYGAQLHLTLGNYARTDYPSPIASENQSKYYIHTVLLLPPSRCQLGIAAVPSQAARRPLSLR